jgi:hypothetical protein
MFSSRLRRRPSTKIRSLLIPPPTYPADSNELKAPADPYKSQSSSITSYDVKPSSLCTVSEERADSIFRVEDPEGGS